MITVNYLSSMKKYKYVFIVYDAKGEQVALQDIYANNEVQARRIMHHFTQMKQVLTRDILMP